MPRTNRENPWGAWVSQDKPGTFAHPDAPDGGSGYGYSRESGPSGTDVHGGGTPDAHSLDGHKITSWQAAVEYAKFEVARARQRLSDATTWEALRLVAEQSLGDKTFGLGACYGIVKNPVMSVAGLLQLMRMLIEADLYERLTRRVTWKTMLRPGSGFGLPKLSDVGYHLAMYAGVLSIGDLKRAYETREALIKNAEEMIRHPVDAAGKMTGQIKAEYVAKWNRFRELQKRTDLKSQFEAGELFGEVLMEVVMVVLTVISVGGAAVKLAAKVPQLVRLAEVVKGARAARAGGVAAEGVDTAKGAKTAGKAVSKEPVEGPKPNTSISKAPVAADLYKVEANGIKPVQIRQGTNGKVAVIGRSMNRVEPYAAELRAQGYEVEIFKSPIVPAEAEVQWAKLKDFYAPEYIPEPVLAKSKMFQANDSWAKKLVSEGYTVTDVGSAPGAGESIFYNMEKATIF